jgi:metal-responsive CopG/Arc/MetJ family transcriptional regulator
MTNVIGVAIEISSTLVNGLDEVIDEEQNHNRSINSKDPEVDR